jgi:predicted RNA binding protein YcfA (HicA-like mRNA interferase family)
LHVMQKLFNSNSKEKNYIITGSSIYKIDIALNQFELYTLNMGKYEKLIFQILRGTSDANILFSDLINLLKHFGFEMRVKGSHHIFRKSGVEEKVNLQKDGNKAKPYQVRQVRNIILKYKLGDNG